MGPDCGGAQREAVVPKVLGMVEKQLDRLSDIAVKMQERLDTVTRASTADKPQQSESPSYGVPMAERFARIEEGLESIGDRLQSLLDRLEI